MVLCIFVLKFAFLKEIPPDDHNEHAIAVPDMTELSGCTHCVEYCCFVGYLLP